MQPNMKNHMLSQEEIDSVLHRAHVGHLGTLHPDGYPYVTPIHYLYMDGKIYIHGTDVGQKVENLLRDPRVGFAVYDGGAYQIAAQPKTACNVNTEYESVIITGKARLIEDEALKYRVLQEVVRKYVPSMEQYPMPEASVAVTGVIEMEIETITGKYYR